MPSPESQSKPDHSAAEVRRLQSRLASVAEDRDRRLSAKDVVIEDQERVIIALEAENEALKAGPREWRVAIRRPGVDGEGVSYSGLNEWEARRVYASETIVYAKDEPCATVVLLSRIVRPWEDVSPAFDEQRPADQCEDCDRVQQCLHKPCPRLASRGSYPTPEEGR